MTRSEFVRWLVLNEITDDFEKVDQLILRGVANTGAKCGLTITRAEVVEALAGLVRGGLVKAYILSGMNKDPFAGEIEGMPPMDVVEEDFHTYFYVTKKGMNLHQSDHTWWPLDDDGNLKPDWRLDPAA